MTEVIDSEPTDADAMRTARAKVRMLEQMAEALEDEAAGLVRRAAGYEEEEYFLEQEIEARQTAIHRLTLKLGGLRADRAALLAQVDSLAAEAAALREEVYRDEEARALAAIERASARPAREGLGDSEATGVSASPPAYFRRARLADAPR